MIYQIYDIAEGEEMGLIRTSMTQEKLQELFEEYTKKFWDKFCEGKIDDFSLDHFVEIYGCYDVERVFVDGAIYLDYI